MRVLIHEVSGNVAVTYPAAGYEDQLEMIAQSSFPEGTTYWIVEADKLPDEPQESWTVSESGIVSVDPEKLQRVREAAAGIEKNTRINAANEYVNSRQWPGKAAVGRLKGNDMEFYLAWLDYLDALEAVDTASAPDIIWPDAPSG